MWYSIILESEVRVFMKSHANDLGGSMSNDKEEKLEISCYFISRWEERMDRMSEGEQ